MSLRSEVAGDVVRGVGRRRRRRVPTTPSGSLPVGVAVRCRFARCARRRRSGWRGSTRRCGGSVSTGSTIPWPGMLTGLSGVPALIKENTDVAGWPTTNGSSADVRLLGVLRGDG